MKQTKSRRILALFLSLVMFVSLLPLQAFSEAELTEQTETIMEQTMETDVSDETAEPDEPADSDEPETEEPDEPEEEAVEESDQQEEPDAESVIEPEVTPEPADDLEVTPQPSEEAEAPPEETQEGIPDEEAEDEPFVEPDDPLPQESNDDMTEEPAEVPIEEPADENADQEAWPEMVPTEELPVDEEADVQMTIADCITAYGHAYATTQDTAMVYADSVMQAEQHIFTISQAGALLLATAYVPETEVVKVWFMASDGEILTGYIHADVLAEIPVTDEQADEMANILWFDYADSEAGTLLVFVVAGEKLTTQEEQPAEEPAVDKLPIEGTTEEAEVPETEAHAADIGDFLYVTTQTRVFMEVDDTAADDYYGDYFLGHFLKDAAVQVEDVLEDSFGRAWYGISYVFGPDEGDGLICELVGHVYVLADETTQTDLTWRMATDYGYPPDYMRPMLLANFYMDLEDHYGGVASFYVGESGLHATTGHDNEYLQIARHDEYGTIFATPHYLKGETAYCLEHTQNSPVVRDHDSGPYTIVDLDGYRVTPGHSGYIFSDKTMHALAWVLRHTYPFMVLDRSDADNDVWCRVAGQFAMREVVKQIEGDYYVRDYWEMDEFYRAYDQAPGVYLEYARWLAEEALDYVENIGSVTVADKSVRASGGQYIGTATLYTSADQMRISKSVGTVTGNSGGDDWEYYYLYSGDTVSITSSKSKFSVPIEIMPSSDDEACFYVGVTNSDIQKLFLPVYGDPYPILATTLEFEVPHGAASVTKKDAVSGSNLSGATFELLSGSTVIQTLTTGSGGTATFSNLTPGTYTIREKTPPQGYLNASPNTQTVTVTAGNTASVTFTNNRKTSRIRIQKTDQLTGQALAGAEFTITRLSAPAGSSGVGSVAAVITTDANGAAETGWLEWGRFRITETKVPEDYQDSGYSVEIEAYENGKTYVIDVQNQPIPGYIQMTKTDVNRGTPLSGVQFDIYYNDAYGSGLAGTMTTNADGVARSGALRKGTYQVKEYANPEGYTGELVTLNAIVRPDETTYLSADNQPIQGKIRIQKSDQLTGEALAGAEFTITRLSSSSSAGGAGVGETVILTTDANGAAETGWLDYGTYEVRETKVPVHFVDNGFSQQIALFEHEKTYTLDVENEPTKGYIQIVKTDALDQMPIEGVQFDIFYNDEYGEGLAATMTTNADGVAISEPIRKGKYIVREHTNPTGYVSELVELHAEVKSDETTYLSAENQPIQGQIRIVKKDELTKDALAGAEFTITRISGLPSHKGAGDGEVVAVMTTDANGVALSPLLTWGTYLVEETVVPVHFVDNNYSIEVTIDAENMQTYEVAVENEPTKGYIQIVKTDSLDQTQIEGVQFDIYYNDEYGEGLAATMTTNADGVAVSEPLRKGKYIVREHANPTGYVSELVELHAEVKSDETTYLSADNQPIQGQIRIIKKDELTGDALAGAEFTITRISGLPSHKGAGDGDVVAVITTGADGTAISPLLTWGTYRVEETVVPVHFVDNDYSTEVTIETENLQTIEVEVKNEPTKGFIQLTKTDRLNGNPIEGVKFDLYYNDQYGEGLATSMVTDANGVALSEPIRKGRYIVKENGATVGYFFEEVALDATVKSDETTELEATNQPVMAKLRIYKRDADEYGGDIKNLSTRGDGKLTGAEFQVLATEDILDRQGNIVHAKGDIVVPSILTEGEDAAALTSDLWPGRYEIVEVTPPAGYAASDGHFFVDTSSAAEQSEEAVIVYDGLKTNEVLYGAKAIVKLLGDDNTDPDPERVETPEEGAEFEVYLASAGSYEDARVLERDYLVTDENGYAMTKPLPYGMYVLRQTVAKDGYEIKGPILFEIKGTEKLTNPPILTLTNMPILYRLRLIKTDTETGRIITLANTSFKLKDANGEYVKQMVYYPREEEIDTFTTDETGCVTLPETVTWGLYFIEEVESPEGYLIRSEDFAVFVGREGDTPDTVYELDIEIPNDPVKGQLRLEKKGLQLTGFEPMTDAYGNEYQKPIFELRYLAGAVFEVRAAEDIVGRDGTVWFEKDTLVDTITTTEAGGDMSKVLPLGKYIVTEVETPAGYVCDPKEYEAELVFADNQTAMVETTVEIENAYLPAEITLLKEKEILQTQQEGEEVRQIATTTPGEGFVFGLFTDQDIRYSSGTLMADTLVATGATDEHGSLTFSGLFPHGAYYVRELSAPDGWKLSAERYPVTLDPAMKAEDAHVIRVAFDEPIHNELIYSKITLTKTDITGEETLPGAQIEVRNEDGEVIYRAYTDENGEIPDIPVTPGRYTFREIYAPEGYELNETEMQFEVDADGNITGDTTIRDDFTRVQLVKLDENDQPLEGVQFTLSSMDGDILKIEVSDENGLVTFDRIPYGTFVIEESRPLNGYIFTDKKVTVIVTGEFVNPLEPLDTFKNYLNQAVIRKVDQNGKSLEGAVFGLFDKYGIREVTAVSDENGMVRFEKIPHGDYTIREIEAPLGYLLCKEIVNLTVDDSYVGSDTPIATLTNHFKRLRYKKVDTSGKALAGVEFSLINAKTNEIVETVVSDERGEIIFTEFDYGDWIIRETKVPDGYMQMEDITLHVDEGWTEPEPFTCVNVPNTYDFLKVDNRRNPIPGVLFALEDSEGNVIGEFESGEDGVVHVTGLVPGSYVIRETRPADGFTKTDEVIELTIDENYEQPKHMKRIKNYPTIQTGVDLMVTPVMMAGGGLLVCSVILMIVYAIKNRRRRR